MIHDTGSKMGVIPEAQDVYHYSGSAPGDLHWIQFKFTS